MIVRPALLLQGSVRPPGDKSISHRAVLLSALAEGVSHLRGLADGADVACTIEAMRALGADIEQIGAATWRVEGFGLRLRPPAGPIDCGNSGTTMRLLAGILAGQPFESVLCGDDSLSRRPMARVAEPLRAMGARIEGDTAPLNIRGSDRLQAIEFDSPRASAQVKSAVLLAGLFAKGRTTVREPHDSRDHTERMLTERGVPVVGKALSGPVQSLRSMDVDVPTDPSSAAFAHCAAAVIPGSDVTARSLCMSATRTGYLDVLRAMGAQVDVDGEDVRVRAASTPKPVTIDGALTVRCLDEIPALAVALARLPGRSRICDAAELRVKESDRLATTTALLTAAGVAVSEGHSGLEIEGDPTRPLSSFSFHAEHDHRLAMAAAIAALMADGPCAVTPDDATATSYPTFWTDLEELAER